MKRIALLSVLISSLTVLTNAQEKRFFVPRELKAAYENGTRSYDGKPGDQYWQNTVDYNIEVEVNPETRELTGSETIVFNNNSPDNLSQLIIRLYHDVFRKGNQRGSSVNTEDVNEGVEISKLTVDGSEIDMEKGILASAVRGRLTIEAEAETNFKTDVPNDARYRIERVEITLRAGTTAKSQIKENSGRVTLRKIQTAQPRSGNYLVIKIARVSRVNFRGDREPVNARGLIYNIPIN
ncbi:MAG: hypothetical protein IH947_05955 [Bacteroidetes bacterium]|nr:hypothetical protein [Bacteroidota bacterium]